MTKGSTFPLSKTPQMGLLWASTSREMVCSDMKVKPLNLPLSNTVMHKETGSHSTKGLPKGPNTHTLSSIHSLLDHDVDSEHKIKTLEIPQHSSDLWNLCCGFEVKKNVDSTTAFIDDEA